MGQFVITDPATGKKYRVQGETAEGALSALRSMLAQKPVEVSQRTPAEDQVRALTDQAKAAYAAGDDAEGKRLLIEATRAAQDQGMMPEGIVADPQTGGTVDLRADPTIPEGQAVSAGFGAMQGLGYNFGDELIGGMAAVTGQDPRFYTERARETQRRAQENDPLTYGAANIGGAVASSLTAGKALGLGPAMQGTLGQRTLAGGGLGLAEGAAAGAGSGDNSGDRITNALTYGGLGLGLGLAAPGALKLGGQAWDSAVAGPVASMRSAPSEIRAARALETALKRSGYTAQQIDDMLRQAAQEGQPEFMVADALGNSGQRMLSGIARQPGDARQAVVDALMQRQEGQGNRIAGFLTDALDAPDTAAQRAASLTSARDAAANTAYSAARQEAGAVNLTPTIETIDSLLGRNPILGESALDNTEIGKRLLALRGQMQKGGEQLINFNNVLNIKQDLYTTMKGLRTVPKELSDVYKSLDAALEGASLPYRAANDGFAKGSRAIEAVDAGKASASSRMRYQDVADQYAALQKVSPEAVDGFRAGRADAEIGRIDAAAPGVNKARALLSEKSTQDLGLMANDPALLSNRIGREDTMFRTTQAATGGSMTADNLADAADMQNFDYGLLANIIRSPKTAALQLGPTIANAMQGRNTATRELIAKMLMGRDMQRALAPAIAAETKAGPRRAIIEALVRGLPRPTN